MAEDGKKKPAVKQAAHGDREWLPVGVQGLSQQCGHHIRQGLANVSALKLMDERAIDQNLGGETNITIQTETRDS